MRENNLIPFNEFKVGIKYIDRNGIIRTCVFINKQVAVFEDEQNNSLIIKPDSFNTFTIYNKNRLDEYKKHIIIYSNNVLGVVYLKSKNDYVDKYNTVLTIEEAEALGLKL
jgi:hypothetical protein